MAFSDTVAAMDQTLLTAFSEYSVTIHPQSGNADFDLPVISKNPALEEDYVPGSQTGTTNLLLFVRFVRPPGLTGADAPIPLRGDTATVNGVDYDIWQVDADREGGATLRMRRRAQRWDQ